MSNISNYKYDWIWNKNAKRGFLNAKKRPLKQTENISIFSYGVPVYYPQMERRGLPRDKGSHNKRRMGNGDMAYGGFKNIVNYNNIYYPSDLITVSNAAHSGSLHPTQKPIELLRYLIRTYTNEGETVLDNTMGSGSTCVACLLEHRHYIGIEKDKGYFDIANKRIDEARKELSLF